MPAQPNLGVHPRQDACEPVAGFRVFDTLIKYFIPSQLTTLLATARPSIHDDRGQSGFLLHTVTGLHWPDLYHYYGIICHLTLT